MDPRTRNTSKQSEAKKDLPTDPGAEMKLPKAEDEVLGAIAGVEQQLSALRKAHAEHRAAMAELAEKRRELSEAAEGVKVRESQVEDRAEELEAREGELTSREVELAEMRQEVEGRESDVAQRAARIEQRESKIAQQAEQLERQEAQVASRAEELESEAEALGRERQKIELTAKELAERAGSLEQREASLGEREASLVERESQVEEKLSRESTAESRLSAAERSLRQLEGKLKGRELELGERSKALEEMAERAGALEAELNQTRRTLEATLHEVQEKLTRERKVSEGLRAQIEVAEEEARNASGSVKRVGELESLLAEARAEIERVRAEGGADAGEAAARAEEAERALAGERERIAALEGEVSGLREKLKAAETRVESSADQAALDAALAEVESLRRQMDELAKSADEEITGTRKRAEQLEASLKAAEARLAKAEGDLANAVQARDSARKELEGVGTASEEADRLRDALTAAVDKIAEAETGAEAAREEVATLRSELEAKGAALEKAESAVLTAEGEGRDLKARVEELEIELEVANAKPRPQMDEFVKTRRKRMSRQRRLLRDQSAKIRRATEALRDRLDQCEAVLQKRAELAQAYQAIVDMRQRNAKREVRGGVIFGVIGLMAVIGMLGAASWFISGRVAPGEYAASVIMRGEAGPRQTLSESDALAWRAFTTEMVTDPRFLEKAAERMKRRGITSLGTAGELGREIKTRLTVETPKADEVRMEWRGEGADRTRRVLDTFAVALSSVSNEARGRRSDGATTVISQESTASAEPLDTRRMEMAGMIFGGSTGFMLVMGGVLWRRLAAAKAKFERDVRIDPLLDDAQWQMPGGA